jgi:hypothetical protein
MMRHYPPDPHPFLHVGVVLCFTAAVVTLFLYLSKAFQREFSSAYTEDDARQASDRVSKALPLLLVLRGAPLRRQCLMIIRDLRISSHFTLHNLREYYIDRLPEDDDIVQCMAKALRVGRLLLARLVRARFMLSFAPLRSLGHKQTIAATQQYEELFRLIQCCNFKLLRYCEDCLPAFGIVHQQG